MNKLICRSMLYMPASNDRALKKAESLACDAIAIDLEDSVDPQSKPYAREAASNAIKARPYGDRIVVLRINGMGTQWHADDLSAAMDAQPDAILLPKVETADDVATVADALEAHDQTAIAIWAMIETPAGITNVDSIAAAAARHSSKAACCLGNNDLTIAAGMRPAADRNWLVPWMMQLLLACKTHHVHCLDGVFNIFSDSDGFDAECEQGASMGFDGKTLIHPSQIDRANQAFSPSEQTISEAKKIIAAYQLPHNHGRSAIQLDGAMVERLHLQWAERVLLLADNTK